MIRVVLALFLCATFEAAAQHHLNAGATAPTAGSQLLFVNGAEYDTNSAFFVRLTKNATNGFNGEYAGNISVTSLAADPLAPEPGHAAPGAYLELEMVSVQGPGGGSVSFWMNDSAGVPRAKFTVPSGTTAGTNRYNLSEGDGSPGSDPFGHIHGRNFSASLPGLYEVGLRVVDTSKNGPNGGPIHPPSDLYYIYFQAGVTADIRVAEGKVRVRYPAPVGKGWTLERATDAASAGWESVATTIAGDDHMHEFEQPSSSRGFFRVRGQ